MKMYDLKLIWYDDRHSSYDAMSLLQHRKISLKNTINLTWSHMKMWWHEVMKNQWNDKITDKQNKTFRKNSFACNSPWNKAQTKHLIPRTQCWVSRLDDREVKNNTELMQWEFSSIERKACHDEIEKDDEYNSNQKIANDGSRVLIVCP